jgi:hypothetical protein
VPVTMSAQAALLGRSRQKSFTVDSCHTIKRRARWDAAFECIGEKSQPRLCGLMSSGWCGLPVGG